MNLKNVVIQIPYPRMRLSDSKMKSVQCKHSFKPELQTYTASETILPINERD